MNKLVLVLCLFSTPALSYGLQVAEPKRVYMSAHEYQDMYDPYLAPLDKDLKYGGVFGTDFYILRHKSYGVGLYWDNELHFDQSERDGKIKHAGWKYELGLSVLENNKGNPKIELFKQHWSRHVMEETRDTHFPVYDRYGIRFNIYP